MGSFEAVSAIASYSDGTTRAVAATYTSANTSIAIADTGGNIRAVGAGTTTVTATFSGATATVLIRGIPNFAGRWFGQFRFLSCSAPPRWGGSYCAGTAGTLYNIELTLVANGSQVTGSIRTTGIYVGSVSGTIAADGTLSLQGSYSLPIPNGLAYTEQIRNWQTRTIDGTAMTGRWDTIGLLTGESQTAFNQYEMVTVNKIGQ